MSTLNPPPAYTPQEILMLYPAELELKQVFVFIRHGERTPTAARFRHLSLNPFWNQCGNAGRFTASVLSGDKQGTWDHTDWERHLETFGHGASLVSAIDAYGHNQNLCGLGELTDIGRESMLDLGSRLRTLYVDQLKFLPPRISSCQGIHLRCSPIPRTLESLHQAFQGLYPSSKRDVSFRAEITMRDEKQEILMPNEGHCPRFIQMMKAYTELTARRWNGTRDMKLLNEKLRVYMPDERPIAVDSKPKLSGIYDTINATMGARDPKIQLPPAFYEPELLEILDKIAYEEEFGPFRSNHEYRTLGIGALMGDLVARMANLAIQRDGGMQWSGHPDRFYLASGHDSTVIPVLSSMGALQPEDHRWPKFSSMAVVELFCNRSSLNTADVAPVVREPTEKVGSARENSLQGWYVRMRYNNKEVTVPGCQVPGKHLQGRPAFCTLAAFKEIVDKITPKDWTKECNSNLDKPPVPPTEQAAGF